MKRDENIVITGCSTGIGLDVAKYLSGKGIKVYPTARDVKDVQMLADLGFEAYELDVRKPEQISHVIKSVVEQDGKIDNWFNNAGYGQAGMMEDITTDSLREQFETNLFGLHECTRQVVPIMRSQGYGKIIQHSSVLGLISLAGRGAYNSSKYAVEGLTDTLRLELRDTDIYPVLLNTGPVTSEFGKNALKMLQKYVDIDSSIHRKRYEASLNGTSRKVPFNLEAIAVSEVVYKIVTSKKPKPRYYITKATYILGYLKRLLSTQLLDRVLARIG